NAVAGKFPLSEVPAVPFLVKSAQAGSVAFWRLYKTGLLDSEYDQIVPLATGMLGAGGLHLSAPLKSIDDLGGLKLIVAGQMQSKTIAALGGAPISIPLTDEYQAVQRKTVDGVIIGWGGVRSFKLQQVRLITSISRSVPRSAWSSWRRRNSNRCRRRRRRSCSTIRARRSVGNTAWRWIRKPPAFATR